MDAIWRDDGELLEMGLQMPPIVTEKVFVRLSFPARKRVSCMQKYAWRNDVLKINEIIMYVYAK